MSDTPEPTHTGDSRHPDHEKYLLELGRANYAAARLAGVMVDLLRVHAAQVYDELAHDAHGRLRDKLERRAADIPGLAELIPTLVAAIDVRNALAHGLPNLHGVTYTSPKTGIRYRFYDVDDLVVASRQLAEATAASNRLLYADGGVAVRTYVGKSDAHGASPAAGEG